MCTERRGHRKSSEVSNHLYISPSVRKSGCCFSVSHLANLTLFNARSPTVSPTSQGLPPSALLPTPPPTITPTPSVPSFTSSIPTTSSISSSPSQLPSSSFVSTVWVATPAATLDWYSITSSSSGCNLAVAANSGIFISSGGLRRQWLFNICSPNNRTYAHCILRGADAGMSWILTSAPVNVNWYAIASNSNGSMLAAVVNGGGIYVSTSKST